VYNDRGLFRCGDGHVAQGNGEVDVNGIEYPLDAILRFHLYKHQSIAGPIVEASDLAAADCSTVSWMVVETGTDLAMIAQAATNRMVDLLVSYWSFSEVHAYILCSVAMRCVKPGS
jgi:acetamidase/formamidase